MVTIHIVGLFYVVDKRNAFFYQDTVPEYKMNLSKYLIDASYGDR